MTDQEFDLYKIYLKIYPEWFLIKKLIEGQDITILSQKENQK